MNITGTLGSFHKSLMEALMGFHELPLLSDASNTHSTGSKFERPGPVTNEYPVASVRFEVFIRIISGDVANGSKTEFDWHGPTVKPNLWMLGIGGNEACGSRRARTRKRIKLPGAKDQIAWY